MQSSSERTNKHINKQINIAMKLAELSQDKLFEINKNQVELAMNNIESAIILDKLNKLRNACLNLCKQAGIIPDESLWFDTPNCKLVFNWCFKAGHIRVSLHRFTDGMVYLDYKPCKDSCETVLDALDRQLVKRFFSNKVSMN